MQAQVQFGQLVHKSSYIQSALHGYCFDWCLDSSYSFYEGAKLFKDLMLQMPVPKWKSMLASSPGRCYFPANVFHWWDVSISCTEHPRDFSEVVVMRAVGGLDFNDSYSISSPLDVWSVWINNWSHSIVREDCMKLQNGSHANECRQTVEILGPAAPSVCENFSIEYLIGGSDKGT